MNCVVSFNLHLFRALVVLNDSALYLLPLLTLESEALQITPDKGPRYKYRSSPLHVWDFLCRIESDTA